MSDEGPYASDLEFHVDELVALAGRTDPPPTPLPASKGVKHDSGKVRYDLIPPECLKAVAQVVTFGAEKYTPNNWKLVRPARERYLAALMRHVEASRSGEARDPETGLSHLAHAACNCLFLLWFEEHGETDA